MVLDITFTVLDSHGIPVSADTRRCFEQGRIERERSRALDATKQGGAFRRLLSFRSWGNAARLAGWLYEHKRRVAPVHAPMHTRNPTESAYFARIIAARHGEFI